MKQLTIHVVTASAQQAIHLPNDLADQKLSDILRRSSFALNTRCGGRGLCDGCLVHLQNGTVRSSVTMEVVAGTGQAIRACEHTPAEADLTVSIPARSLLAYEPQVVSNFKVNISRSHNPIWQAADVAPEHAVHPSAALAERLDAPVLATLPLPSSTRTVALEYRHPAWTILGPLDHAPANPLGVAIDIGTTTVAVLVVELATGKVVASASGFNRQMHLGDDVLTRINLCTTDKQMLGRLQTAIVKDTIERLLLKALKEAGIADDQIACVNIAGNTTMLHLFAGVDPSPMGFAPFTAPFLEHQIVSSSKVHLKFTSPEAAKNTNGTVSTDPSVHLLPSAAAYVGADITAGVVSSGLVYDDGPSLLVDVGTNGEIVFKQGNHMWGTATAAGPAFEGSRMACGMRAGQGAISHIRMAQHERGLMVDVEVIGNVKPTGICGSAYVDFLAQAREVGLLSASGRFEAGVADGRVAPYRDLGRGFTIAFGHGHEPIVITEGDIASLLQAKAAIAAGILTLLRKVNAAPESVKALYLAGGFGMHLDIANTIACGLLPGFRTEQVQLVGNTSLAGAYLSLLDAGVLDEIARVAKAIEMVELNLDPEFESCYIDQLML